MAISEGLSSRADFNTALAEAGEIIKRIRKAKEDTDGNRQPAQTITQRVLIETVRLQAATQVSDEGGSNVSNSAMKIVYLSVDDGEPMEDDIIERGHERYALADLDYIPVGDDIVYYFATMLRIEKVKN